MSNYAALTAALMQAVKAKEDALPLRNEDCRSRLLLKSRPTEKVCLFFHGFTSAPFQFDAIGAALSRAGYNVLAPLMPGHGRAGNFNQSSPPPLPTNPEAYQKFAVWWLERAKSLGNQVIVGGLSGGGTLAAWLAFTYPEQIYVCALF